ncbi:uroporphyrinogen decarboxylase [Moraxella bovoculi]|uniref:Uroporphyrinogen decarboxylase n=1 Tax=Moraxella bovoculi TaxID=386891 RepID=A0AAC8PV31_9GAMM|nr:uroporphyrinogen decarboxylase [Moraxella bovoculi]AKG07530.1 uroporphyrinogen decarboxylase [Moraxella bovoculi]AKG09865.1 uroporphyrinogen decarboxylase [Moraxella bovoculi]AKG11786.1 uroporphyrinogen decarboxylase [Moraxella bovoculi]AKG13752.1 uroporphyrinogen decarboxylase [Moraxella bovoculi]
MTTHNFPTLKNDRLLRALRFEPVDTTPVWMMRQAGRYLPEYKATRAEAGDFLSLCKDTARATEVTLQPLCRFELDAAILFSDILTVPDALDLGLYFETGEGPRFKKTVRTEADIANLPTLNMADLSYVTDAVTSIRHALGGQVPLFGFSGSPWTLATYMIEGGGSKEYRHAKEMMYARPELMHALLTKIADAVTEYLEAQIVAGANLVQIFDSWGGALGHRQFAEFSHQYNRRIINALKAKYPDVPVVMFTKGGGLWVDVQADSQADALGFDWTMPLDKARAVLGRDKAIQGNLDPATLYGTPDNIRQAVQHMLTDVYGSGIHTGYVANFGHGITQWANPDHAKVFVDAVHEFKL